MTPLERFKSEAKELQRKKNVLFTPEICASKTYADMHRNKGALNESQSKFLAIVEKFNDDCLVNFPKEFEYDEEAVNKKLKELEETLVVITNTIYTILWEN